MNMTFLCGAVVGVFLFVFMDLWTSKLNRSSIVFYIAFSLCLITAYFRISLFVTENMLHLLISYIRGWYAVRFSSTSA